MWWQLNAGNAITYISVKSDCAKHHDAYIRDKSARYVNLLVNLLICTQSLTFLFSAGLKQVNSHRFPQMSNKF